MSTVVVTGANRGLGLEFVRQFLQRGSVVYGGCREPEASHSLRRLADSQPRLTVLPLDVSKPNSIQAFAERVSGNTPRLDLLVNNAGILPDEPNLSSVTVENLMAAFAVNAVGPVLMIKSLRALLAAGKGRILNVSSGTASMQNAPRLGVGLYSYAASKSALNRLGLALARELHSDGVAIYSFEPGWVKTDMARGGGTFTPEEAITAVLKVFDRLTLEDSGGYFNWLGERHPW